MCGINNAQRPTNNAITWLVGLCCLLLAAALPLPAHAQEDAVAFDIPAVPLADAVELFGEQSGMRVLYDPSLAEGADASPVSGNYPPREAIRLMLEGTGLTWVDVNDQTLVIRRPGQDAGTATGSTVGQRRPGIEEIIVTGQKREERIQDVPIAISAFSQEDLTVSQIAGGPDLMTQIPNFTFTKTNFSSYSIQIRGIGTQAISATVDPAVAVAFNSTPFIANRFFEQEFYDMERVEVLRGPQGTLFGRNATAGVVNLISARPVLGQYESMFSVDVANYDSRRLEGMINIPLVDDTVGFRFAGAWTKRDGYVTNTLQDEQTDGRNLWSTRATLRVNPSDRLDVNLVWEYFEEDDDRLRSGKQLCTRHDVPEVLDPAGDSETGAGGYNGARTYLSQGCQMGSLYDDEAFQVPNGFSLPYYGPLGNAGAPIQDNTNPYAGTTQSKDLREIETHIDPEYRARSNILHLAVEYALTDGLTLNSETAYNRDRLFSFNDFNRFNTTPGVFDPTANIIGETAVERGLLDEDGAFCDPQLGCSNRLVAADVSTAESEQVSQEFRLTSNFDGPFNFHLGVNYLNYDAVNKYYVFANTLTLFAASRLCVAVESLSLLWDPRNPPTNICIIGGRRVVDPNDPPPTGTAFDTAYIDPNPIDSLNDSGRNYFLSKNPFTLNSYAVFGEAAYELTPDLKLTAGLRYTVDQKDAPIVPTWLLVQSTFGLPVKKVVEQEWREPTGRLVVDWQPQLAFTDETLLYASYAHGYKAGGANPPLPGALTGAFGAEATEGALNFIQATQPETFDPEFVDAFEIGTKNTLFDGRVTFNLGAFYYDYEGYQISQIVNRSALNLNFDAEIWGLELETDWRPVENLRLAFKGGYERTKLSDDQSVVDPIDRTAGNPDWIVVKPFPTIPSNCVAPYDLFVELSEDFGFDNPGFGWCNAAYLKGIDPTGGDPGFDPASAPNGGAGFAKDVGGNELPNAPDTTMTLSADYTIPLSMNWLLTLHGDYYRQSEAWARIFNEDPYDRIKPFSQINLAAILESESGWNVMFYVKNLQDKDNITGAFLNSDDTGLTTNVFLNEPRLVGVRVTKEW